MSGANTWRGANTWSVALNENAQGSGGSSGVQSITAGTNITLGGTSADPIINSTATTGVTSLTAGSGISVSSATGAITVGNTGVLSLTAGTNVSLTGTAQNPIINSTSTGVQSVSAGTNTTITGTAQNPIINSTSTGVQSLTAGSGVVLTGTAQNPIVSASYSPPTSGTVFDFAGGPVVVIPVNQINECVIINSLPTAPPTIQIVMNVPNYTALVAQFGANAVVHFTIGNLQNGLMPTSMLVSSVPASPANSTRFSNNLEGAVASNPQPLQMLGSYADPYSFPTACLAQMFRVSIVIDSVYQRATYCLTWLGQPS